MLRRIVGLMAIVAAGALGLQGAAQEQSKPIASAATAERGMLNQYCVACHNEKLKTAGLMLDKQDLDNVGEGAELWEKVIRKLRTGAMPPAGRPRPDQAGYASMAS